MACKMLDRNFVGIEIDSDYIKIAEARIAYRSGNPVVEEAPCEESKPVVKEPVKKDEIVQVTLFELY